MKYVIRIIENAAGLPCPEAGMFVKNMDFTAHGGIGHLEATPNIADARRFAHSGEVLDYYNTVPRNSRYRPDGKMNRPLTAYTIEIVPVPA